MSLSCRESVHLHMHMYMHMHMHMTCAYACTCTPHVQHVHVMCGRAVARWVKRMDMNVFCLCLRACLLAWYDRATRDARERFTHTGHSAESYDAAGERARESLARALDRESSRHAGRRARRRPAGERVDRDAAPAAPESRLSREI